MTLTIHSNDSDFPSWIHPVTTRDYLDSLEEALYILWELSPATRMWKAELVQTGVTSFKYAEDIALVRWIGDLTYEVTM